MINSTDKIIVVDTSAKATPINVSILIMFTKNHQVLGLLRNRHIWNPRLFCIHLTTRLEFKVNAIYVKISTTLWAK